MDRALVLSGGGTVGIAWQAGLTVGLAEQGVQLADADLIVGTSAGSAVGAQIALGRDLNEQIERYRQADARRASAPEATRRRLPVLPTRQMQKLMEVMTGALTEDADPEHAWMLIGKFALEAETIPEAQFVESFRYLDGESWPRRYACTAVDAETGAFIVWDAGNQAELPRAVASSCAVPGVFPPITIDGRRYIDGGMRSGTNADLAEGNDRVLIVSLMGCDTPRCDHRPAHGALPAAYGPRAHGPHRRRWKRRAPRPRRRGGRGAGREPDGPDAARSPPPRRAFAKGARRPNCSATSGSRSALKFPPRSVEVLYWKIEHG